jgi:hypothetical protein
MIVFDVRNGGYNLSEFGFHVVLPFCIPSGFKEIATFHGGDRRNSRVQKLIDVYDPKPRTGVAGQVRRVLQCLVAAFREIRREKNLPIESSIIAEKIGNFIVAESVGSEAGVPDHTLMCDLVRLFRRIRNR